jgi:hypothetical protein
MQGMAGLWSCPDEFFSGALGSSRRSKWQQKSNKKKNDDESKDE